MPGYVTPEPAQQTGTPVPPHPRPRLADERLTRNQDGQVMLTLKTPYRDGTTHIVLSLLEFKQRLAALVNENYQEI